MFNLQTFHTPSFGDEGFDIPSMGNQGNNSNTSSSCNNVSSPSNSSADSIITSHTQPQPSLAAYQHSQVSALLGITPYVVIVVYCGNNGIYIVSIKSWHLKDLYSIFEFGLQ